MQKELELEEIGCFVNLFHAAKEYEATDLYILEGRLPRIGRLKDYIPAHSEGSIEPSRGDIEQFILDTIYDDFALEGYLRIKHNKDGDGKNNKEVQNNLDYAFSIKGYGRYRVSATVSEEGWGLSIRKLPYYIPSIAEIDKKDFLRGIKQVLEGKETSGLIIHTGVTGSGKSTLIASEIDAISKSISGNILTFENPIEYKYESPSKALIRQYEVGRHINSYTEGLRFALRNNPSVVVLGEVRSHEEIKEMIDMAMRGHLIFSTMHTSNALNTIRFLDSIGESKDSWRQLVAYSLKAVISQRLIYKRTAGFVFIPEVFIPSEVARNKLARGEFRDVKDMFYGNNLRETGSFTLEESLNILYREGIVTDSERRSMSSVQQFFI